MPPPLNRVITFPTAIPAPPRSFPCGLGHQDSSSLRRIRAIVLASAEMSRPLLRHLLGKAGEIDFACRRAG